MGSSTTFDPELARRVAKSAVLARRVPSSQQLKVLKSIADQSRKATAAKTTRNWIIGGVVAAAVVVGTVIVVNKKGDS